VPPGQLDRLLAAFRRPVKRPVDAAQRQIRQTGELQVRPTDPACEPDAPLEVPPGVLEPGGPQLRDAEVDQCERPQVFPQA
jgi:hypothetical protein